MEIESILTEIELKVKRLTSRMIRLEKENEDLRNSMFEYLNRLEQQKKEADKLQMEIKALKVGGSVTSDKRKLKKDIDQYIHLIDQCLATLNTELVGK
jgi:chromosome segregation ATPase